MNLAIEAKGITKSFRVGWWKRREKEVLKGIDLEVHPGEIFGILGPNGAGKTTLLSILSALLLPDQGEVRLFGIDLLQNGDRVRGMINLSSGNANFVWSLSVEENLRFYGMLYGLSRREREEKIDQLIDLFDLQEHRRVPFDRLSTGMKQRLSLAKSLLNNPSLLFLDEPTVGLDPSVSGRIRDQIRNIQKGNGMTILLTTHNMREAEFLCHRIAFLKEGKILAIGTPQELKRAIRVGDVIRIEFEGPLPEDELLRFEGVITYSITSGICEVLVDEAEQRAGPLIAHLSEGGTRIKRIGLRQTDLEDVFIEFSKEMDPDQGLLL
ncbi:MAG: ABC transporter ATP-binding protein [Desulfobacterota bacterium]|nr:ABC transporter ATP-binding protein [Thermodesulfobacteriota bacterium]